MSFVDAIKSFFSNYTNFAGRARRSEYWFAYLFLFLASLVTVLLDSMLFPATVSSNGTGIVTGILGLATLLPSLAILARRLHDAGKTAWWILIALVPFIGPIVLLVFLVQDSVPANQWGMSDKAV